MTCVEYVTEDVANATDMVHWCCPCTPLLGLCGTPLRGIDSDIDVECVMCNDMLSCPRCGNRTDL